MIDISNLREVEPRVIFLGSHAGIIQSMLDYDYLIDRQMPSIFGIIAHGRKQERYFWGEKEIFIPVLQTIDEMDEVTRDSCNMVINVQSARRILSTTKHAIELLPNLVAINIFAEQTPEMHTIELAKLCKQRKIALIGPSSVGLLLPGQVKLGAIGGTQHPQISAAGILEGGDVAVISTSGGMVNELIHTVTSSGHGVSFAIALGGDLFPATTPADAFLMAQADLQTNTIVYFGELGGIDEYEITKLIDENKITKKIVAYIAGTVAELFETPPQFGHAKAIARTYDESAKAKKQALRESGVLICNSFADLGKTLKERPSRRNSVSVTVPRAINSRRKGLVVSHISGTKSGSVYLLGKELIEMIESNTLSSLILSMLLGKQVETRKLIDFTDCTLKLLVDHGPQVSGAVNTIVAARAGKDLVSSLTAGLLTIGPRFGGAINAAAGYWLDGVDDGLDGKQFVDTFRSKDGIIPGIGHKKYRLDMPDPRVAMLSEFTDNSNGDIYINFARSVEQVTTTKKGNLILNVDGAIAALMLDLLQSELHMSPKQLRHLVDIEFFNALFVLSRSIGFTAHYLDQRRHDEGLLRLPDDDVRYIG